MNMFEKAVDDDFEAYEYGDKEIDNQIQNIVYTSDAVRVSYVPRKDIIECGFLQDDVKVYLTFISTDISDFSKSFSNEALTAIAQSDTDCTEKFEEIFKVIFGVKFDKSDINVFHSGSSSKGTSISDCGVREVYVSYHVYYCNTQVTLFLSADKMKKLTENFKISELSNRVCGFDEQFDCIV